MAKSTTMPDNEFKKEYTQIRTQRTYSKQREAYYWSAMKYNGNAIHHKYRAPPIRSNDLLPARSQTRRPSAPNNRTQSICSETLEQSHARSASVVKPLRNCQQNHKSESTSTFAACVPNRNRTQRTTINVGIVVLIFSYWKLLSPFRALWKSSFAFGAKFADNCCAIIQL